VNSLNIKPSGASVRIWGASVAIYRLLQKSAFGPEDINLMATAYELALVRLAIKDRNDPLTEIIAKHIIEVAQTGEKDPKMICTHALSRLSGTDREAS
jgi:hypothetical protein